MRNFFMAASLIATCAPVLAGEPRQDRLPSLRGTWTLVAAYEIQSDGTRTTTYGEHPDGLMIVDRAGRYSLQIFRPGRAPFKGGSKSRAEPGELRDAVIGSSTHFGTVSIDHRAHQLVFHVAAASFPNWNGATQHRDYTYADGLLTYRVPAAASGNGAVAYSVWRRAAATP
ncbi:MAG TPA: lipocalin-like domain-containing protein [Allosphingosinicella sp.]